MSHNARGKLLKLFPVAVAELVLFFVSQGLMAIVFALIAPNLGSSDATTAEFLQVFFMLLLFSIHILLCVIYMLIVKPDSKKYLKFHPGQALVGLAVGMLVNAAIGFGAIMGTQMSVSFHGFTLFLLPVFLVNIIQCAAEEVLLRGFVPSFLEEKYSWDVIALLSGVLFIIHHVSNMARYGFDVVFCLNVFLIGCVLILVVKHTRNIWWAVGFHSGWNFTQEYILGLPNSGATSGLALLHTENASSNFFFNAVYGNEGSLLTTVVLLLLMGIIALCYRKKSVQK